MLTSMNGYGSTLGGLMFMWCPWLAIFSQFFPPNTRIYLQQGLQKLINYVLVRFFGVVEPSYVRCSFHEYVNRSHPNMAYLDVEAYLSTHASKTSNLVRAHKEKKENNLVISIDLNETVTEEFSGVKVTWTLTSIDDGSQGGGGGGGNKQHQMVPQDISDTKKCYVLTFDEVHRRLIIDTYLAHVMKQGAKLRLKCRQRKIYKNGTYMMNHHTLWNPMEFEHSANFDTLAMEFEKKEEIMNDLRKFSASKDYYAKIGKAWKRGYLLYGPPGTGKSTMIAAMANFLDYDVYDLELTAVTDNADLFRHLMEISDKSILVIEDIDCSLDLTGQRKKKKKTENSTTSDQNINTAKIIDAVYKRMEGGSNNKSKITLSGLLNFVDGLWSSSGGERIIVFTTNHLEKLDPALIRRGRMDKHIELSYCCFEAFKVLAKNYLDLESHPLFDTIKTLIEEVNITPADVAENLMPKSIEEDADICLTNLIQALEATKAEESLELEKDAARSCKASTQKPEHKQHKTTGISRGLSIRPLRMKAGSSLANPKHKYLDRVSPDPTTHTQTNPTTRSQNPCSNPEPPITMTQEPEQKLKPKDTKQDDITKTLLTNPN